MIQIVHRLYVIVLGYVTFKINKFFVDIYHNFIADKMSYQAEWNVFVGWIRIWPAGHIGKRSLA